MFGGSSAVLLPYPLTVSRFVMLRHIAKRVFSATENVNVTTKFNIN